MSIRKIRYLAKSVVCGLSALAVLPAAHAQVAGADAGEEIKEVVITGSRIARDNSFDVANPIVTLTADQIEGTGQINITNILLRNPALSASVGDNLSGGRDAAFGQTGANLLDLRNLGVDRTLVLVNGKRHVRGYLIRRRSTLTPSHKISSSASTCSPAAPQRCTAPTACRVWSTSS